MKTDLERFQELFKSVGVTFEPKLGVVGGKVVMLTAWEQPKVGGYSGFCATFEFDERGAFHRIMIEE